VTNHPYNILKWHLRQRRFSITTLPIAPSTPSQRFNPPTIASYTVASGCEESPGIASPADRPAMPDLDSSYETLADGRATIAPYSPSPITANSRFTWSVAWSVTWSL
jgi:hypothetical protein